VDAGWKEAVLAAVPSLARQGPARKVELLIDTEDRETISLPVFRRRPWPAAWGLIDIRRNAWERLELPPAAASKGTSPDFLHTAPCLRRSPRGQILLTR